jgi:hypothetical protein
VKLVPTEPVADKPVGNTLALPTTETLPTLPVPATPVIGTVALATIETLPIAAVADTPSGTWATLLMP